MYYLTDITIIEKHKTSRWNWSRRGHYLHDSRSYSYFWLLWYVNTYLHYKHTPPWLVQKSKYINALAALKNYFGKKVESNKLVPFPAIFYVRLIENSFWCTGSLQRWIPPLHSAYVGFKPFFIWNIYLNTRELTSGSFLHVTPTVPPQTVWCLVQTALIIVIYGYISALQIYGPGLSLLSISECNHRSHHSE